MQVNCFLAFVLIFFNPSNAWAWPPLFGAEFTFTNDNIRKGNYGNHGEIVESKENADARNRFANLLKDRCASRKVGSPEECMVTKSVDKYGSEKFRVKYGDGFWFDITLDPQVVEIQTKPSTYEEFLHMKGRMHDDIFLAAKAVGIEPDIMASGGHIHIGTSSAFGKDARLLRNFIVDFANHPELAAGVLDVNYTNAPPLAAHEPQIRDEFKKVLFDFDNGKIGDIQSLARTINKKVYITSFCDVDPSSKFQALCLNRTADKQFKPQDMTVEIRSVRTQVTAEEFLKELKLFQSRIDYLSKVTANGKNVAFLDATDKMSDKEMVNAFYRYVKESGLDWEEYKTLLPSFLRKKQVQVPSQMGVPLVDPSNKNCEFLFYLKNLSKK